MAMLSRQLASTIEDPALNGRFLVMLPFSSGVQQIYAESVQPTYPKISSRPRQRQGTNYYYPELEDIDGLQINFYETDDHRVGKWLMEWRNLVVNRETNEYGLPATYKKDIDVLYFNRKDSNNPFRTDSYKGCWPTDQQPFDLNYEDAEGRLIVVGSFSVDDVKEFS